jgi:hypothetical protein
MGSKINSPPQLRVLWKLAEAIASIQLALGSPIARRDGHKSPKHRFQPAGGATLSKNRGKCDQIATKT